MPRPNPGFSLVELLVVISIGAIVLASVSFITGRSLSVSRQQVVQVRATEDARLHLQRIAGVIRSARPVDCNNDGFTNQKSEYWLQHADLNDLSVFVDIDADGEVELVRYYIPTPALGNTNELHQAITESTSPCVFPTAPTSDRILLQSLDNGSTPLFRYFSGPDDATDEVIPNQAQTNTTTMTRVRPQIIVSLAEGLAAADTDIVTDVVPRAVPCRPSDCTPLSTEPGPGIILRIREELQSTQSETEITIDTSGGAVNAVLTWSTTNCGGSGDVTATSNPNNGTWNGAGTKTASGEETLSFSGLAPTPQTFTLACNNNFGSASATVTVNLTQGGGSQPTITLTAQETTSGGTPIGTPESDNLYVKANRSGKYSIELDWSSQDCDTSTGTLTAFGNWSGGRRYSDDTKLLGQTRPTTGVHSYSLSCANPDGTSARADVRVHVLYAVVTLQPTNAWNYAVNWDTSGVTSCTKSGAWGTGSIPLSGVEPVSDNYIGRFGPSSGLPYNISCRGGSKTISSGVGARYQIQCGPQTNSNFATSQGGCVQQSTSLVWHAWDDDIGSDAPGQCSDLNSHPFGGRKDWRLPTTQELKDLAALYRGGSGLNIFRILQLGNQSTFWASETAGTARAAVNLSDGNSAFNDVSTFQTVCVADVSDPPTGRIWVGNNQANDRAVCTLNNPARTYTVAWVVENCPAGNVIAEAQKMRFGNPVPGSRSDWRGSRAASGSQTLSCGGPDTWRLYISCGERGRLDYVTQFFVIQ